MGAKFPERWEDYELARAGDNWLVFQLPGVFVGDVDGVQADLHGGGDVAAGAVADHPAGRFHDFVFADEFAIRLGTFFGNNLNEFKEALPTRALHFRGLLGWAPLWGENQRGGPGGIREG